jgi:Protein of unknown function (DUF1353)
MTTIRCSYEVSHADVWHLEHPYIRKTSIGTVTVPSRFVWDGASVPRILWNIIPPWGSYSGAALVHDWLYRTRTCCASSTKTITKEEADRVFYELMLEDGVRKSRAWVMWQAVAFLGGKAWSRMKEDDDRLVEANFANA